MFLAFYARTPPLMFTFNTEPTADHLTVMLMLAMTHLVERSMELNSTGNYICSYNVKAWLRHPPRIHSAYSFGVKHGVLLFGTFKIRKLFALGNTFFELFFAEIQPKSSKHETAEYIVARGSWLIFQQKNSYFVLANLFRTKLSPQKHSMVVIHGTENR